ncbi:MAG: hypothetical protein IT236_05585 [Bacteroidia bacterium]|nr:hypothetical protein [Bacteroidia bacterium]
MLIKYLPLLFLLLNSNSLWSQKKPLRKLSPDRPHQTESPITVDKWHVMLESDLMNYTREKTMGDTKNAIGLGYFNLKFGFHERMDIEVISGSYTSSRFKYNTFKRETSVLPDFTFRYKYNIIGNDSGDVAMAIMPLLHSTNFFTEKFKVIHAGLLFNLETELFNRFGFGYTGGLSSFSTDRFIKEYELFSTVSVDYKLVGKLRNFLEVSYRYNQTADYLNTFSFDSGITFTPGNNFQLDAGFYFFMPALKPFVFVGGTIRI